MNKHPECGHAKREEMRKQADELADGFAKAMGQERRRGLGLGGNSGKEPCTECQGQGIKMYGSTATWRGGVGGQAFTNDVCNKCWGSGWEDVPWPKWGK